MKKNIHISLDAMGGDNAPEIVVEGAFQSKVRHPNLAFSFFGNKSKLLPLIDNKEILKDSNIVHTKEIVDANEKPIIFRTDSESRRLMGEKVNGKLNLEDRRLFEEEAIASAEKSRVGSV